MINKITVQPSHPKFNRISCAQNGVPFQIEFAQGVNVLSAPNGHGKSSLMKMVVELLVCKQQAMKPVSFLCKIDDVREHIQVDATKGSQLFHFPVSEMAAKNQIDNGSPSKDFHHEHLVFWMARLHLSHGQNTKELIVDIETLCEQKENAIMLIDEPEIALDATGIEHLSKFLRKYANSEKVQIIVVTHHPFLLLDKKLHQVEMDPSAGYLQSVRAYTEKVMKNFS